MEKSVNIFFGMLFSSEGSVILCRIVTISCLQVNVIVATQILEEGLDVHGCNLVIRFDPAASSCSFIQSRGRARMKGSDYLILIRR